MKKILFFIGVFCSIGVHANLEPPMENYVKICPLIHELAKTVMESRQMGMPIAEAIKPIIEVDDLDIQQLNKEIVINAYKIPIGETNADKQEIVNEFANIIAMKCLETD